ncbi:MAG: acyltransferase family protein [Terracidiphilus sp.]|jgi:peptidoglycan/LPS O-acetylase OafA/YrhL
MSQRDFYIDRLRTVMTALVILHHTAITYGAIGGWFWREIEPSSAISSRLLICFCTINQAYFMGFFFLLAGYFTPASLERKGYRRFIGDRFLRLGLPLLGFGLILAPITVGIMTLAQGHGFWAGPVYLWQHHMFINGPLWFAQALLFFSLAYCGWRALLGAKLSDFERRPKPVPAGRWWLATALATGVVALGLRQFVPVGVNVIGMQLGYFATYIFLFAAGIAAWRYDWLRQLTWKNARTGLITLAITWPLMIVGGAIASAVHGPGKSNFTSGFSWTAILYALWEPFVAWGLIALWLLVFRERMNPPSPLWSWLNRRAYGVYILHPVVLVGISLLLHGWVAPALAKFGVVGLLACAATWLAADPMVRLPGVRHVV